MTEGKLKNWHYFDVGHLFRFPAQYSCLCQYVECFIDIVSLIDIFPPMKEESRAKPEKKQLLSNLAQNIAPVMKELE